MATATKKRNDQVFSKAEVADRRKQILESDLGLKPVSISEAGYLYHAKEALKALKQFHKKKSK